MKEIQLHEILGAKVVDANGVHIGRLEEIEATRGEESCLIDAYIVEHRGPLDRVSSWALTSAVRDRLPKGESSRPYRIGWDEMDLSDPRHPRARLPRESLRRVVTRAPRDT
jgi:sporulation protein YlmC with PRC-barrel domain